MTVLVRSTAPRHARVPTHSQVRGVYLPRLADAAASSMATYTIPLLVLATTGSASLTGVAFALEWVPRLAAFGLAGAAVDRFGATRMFRLASAARAVVVALAAFALIALDGDDSTPAVMLLAASTGILTEFSYIAAETVGAAASRQAGRDAHRVQSILLGIDQGAALAGPVLGGVLLEWTGAGGMLATIGVLSLFAAVIAPNLRRTEPVAPLSVLAGLRTGWSTLRALPALAWLVAGLSVSNLAIGTLQAAAPVLLVKELGVSNASVGIVWTAAAATSLLAIGVCRFAIDRWGTRPVGSVAACVAALACLGVAHAHTYPAYLLLIAVFMAGDGGLSVVLRTLRSRLIPAPVFGSTLSLTVLILLLPYPLAGLLVATVAPDALGQVITACAVLQAIGLAIAFVRVPRPASAPGRQ